jgi:hypothetical protein
MLYFLRSIWPSVQFFVRLFLVGKLSFRAKNIRKRAEYGVNRWKRSNPLIYNSLPPRNSRTKNLYTGSNGTEEAIIIIIIDYLTLWCNINILLLLWLKLLNQSSPFIIIIIIIIIIKKGQVSTSNKTTQPKDDGSTKPTTSTQGYYFYYYDCYNY